MKLSTSLVTLSCFCLLTLGSARAESPDETLKSLPAPVQKTIQAERQQRSIVKIDTKAKDGQKRYKVVMKGPDGMQKRLVLDAGGKLLRLKNDVALNTLPPPVKKTLDANSKGARFVRSTKVTSDDKLEYEAEYDVSGRSKVLLLSPAGKLEKVEEVVLISTLPAPAKAQLEKDIGTAKLLKVEAITDSGKPTIYEVQFESGAHKSEIKIAADGKVLSRE